MKELELSFRSCVVDMPLSKERSVGKESRKRRAIVTSRLRMSSINLSLGVNECVAPRAHKRRASTAPYLKRRRAHLH